MHESMKNEKEIFNLNFIKTLSFRNFNDFNNKLLENVAWNWQIISKLLNFLMTLTILVIHGL